MEQLLEKKISIKDLTNSLVTKQMLFINAISSLDSQSIELAMKGHLKESIKNLNKPNISTFENLLLALKNIDDHENFLWSELGNNIISKSLEILMSEITAVTKAPVICILGGGYKRKGLTIQENGKAIVFAAGLKDATQILSNYQDTLK